jgi:hypothetical protein
LVLTHWLICSKKSAQEQNGNNCRKEVLASHKSPETPTIKRWMHREQTPEDPWISFEDHFDEQYGTILYGGNSMHTPQTGHNILRQNHQGLNVWIRSARDRVSSVKRAK